MSKFKLLISTPVALASWLTRNRNGKSLLLAPGVKVYPTHGSGALIETYVVESFKTGPGDGFDLVIGHKKVFLPSHEQMFMLGEVFEGETRRLGLLG